ncbi:MAG TPA: hypothetical protein VIS94_08055 [Desulfomonilia bacterium]
MTITRIKGVKMAAIRTPTAFHVRLSVAAAMAAFTARVMVAGSAT